MMTSAPDFEYDEQSDTLYVSFAPGEPATGIALSDHILLRVDRSRRRPVGITLLDFSVLAQNTELGPRSFPLTGLAELSLELRELALEIMRAEPVRSVLTLSAYTPAVNQEIPITSIHPHVLSTRAA